MRLKWFNANKHNRKVITSAGREGAGRGITADGVIGWPATTKAAFPWVTFGVTAGRRRRGAES